MSLCWDCKQGGVKPPTRELNALVVAEPDPKPDPKPDSYWDWLPADLADNSWRWCGRCAASRCARAREYTATGGIFYLTTS